ncbi:MAG TPA: glycerol-3-phosphate dehydrogenase/oxidase [Dehalococcoidia bacterium]|nr:glycerol-3-phosphate dehydrogenase/oxidase [Dehalococcoidia bacterium]
MTAGAPRRPPLDGRHFDAVVIGGGINGTGVARDAALRGLSVCLFEKGDYASGTSSRSTKIAHGGLRYLKHYEFGLVFESQRERHILGRLLPHLVWPQSFLYPVYDGDPDPLWKVRLGIAVYDLLAGFRNVERSRRLSPAGALAANPGLRREGLRGAVRYWDDRMDDARMCLENALSATRAGAECRSYTEVLDIEREHRGYRVRYRSCDGDEGSVSAAAVVNCGGPWGDEVARLAGLEGGKLRPTRGAHIVVPRLPLDDALILPTGPDDRVFFVIPWADRSLVGTTDTPFDGDPDAVEPTSEDVDYLLSAAARYLPHSGLSKESISFAYAGLRPLIAPDKPGVDAGAISRRHRVFVTPPAFVTLLGGKYTTYRHMAAEAVDRLLRVLGRPHVPSPTRKAPFFRETYPATPVMTDRLDLYRYLQGVYGPRAGEAFDFIAADERYTRRVVESSPVLAGQLAFALVREEARTLEDLVQRRTRLVWQPDFGPREAHAVLDVLAPLLGGRAAALREEADRLSHAPAWR